MRALAPIVAAVLLAALFAPLIEAQGPGTGPGAGGGPGTGPGARGGERERVLMNEEARDWANLSEAARDRALARAENARLFSRMDFDGANASSRFVGFALSGGSLLGFEMHGANNTTTEYFDLDVTGFEATATPTAHGSVLRAMGNETFFAAHGNPLGLFTYRVRNAVLNMTFTLAPGVNVTADNARTFMLTGTTGLHGHVVLTQNASYEVGVGDDNRTVSVTLGPHARLMFIHHAQATPFTATLHALRDAAASDRVGGILSVVGDTDAPVQDRIFLSGVAMRATHARDGRLDVVVSSENRAGRSVVINVDPASIGLGEGADVTVLLDGEPVPMASSAAEALSSSQALAHVNASANGVQAIVAVPSFSDHTITITEGEAGSTPTPTSTGTTTTAGTTPTPTSSVTPTGGGSGNGTPGVGVATIVALLALVALSRRR